MSLRPNFGFHLTFTNFHLEFSLFGVSRLFDLGDLSDLIRGSGIFFKSYIPRYLKSVHSKEKDEACLGFLIKIFTTSLHRGGVNIIDQSHLD